MKYIIEYWKEIESGKIVAGIELKKQLKKLINLSDEYYVDSKEVEFRINFIEKFVKHTKTPFSGKPFILELWEKAIIEAIYGIKCKSTSRRKFKKVILLIARKNGNSTFCAALAICELFCGNRGTNICVSSNDDAQANIILDEIKDSISLSKSLLKRTHINLKGVRTKLLSKIFKISDKTKNKEGRNIDLGILDESHEMTKNVIAKSIEESQSTKDDPLFINITTEGFINDGYLDNELEYGRKVLNDEIDDEGLLLWLYTQDSEEEIWQDYSTHQKSNPNLGVTKKYEYMERELQKAKYSKKDRVFTLAKDFNIKQNNSEAWLQVEDVEQTEEYNLEEFKNCFALASVDLAETTDLCSAKLLLIRKKDKKKCIISKFWIPSEKIEKSKDGVDYKEWVRKGYIEVTPGFENDFSLITKWFLELNQKYGIYIYRGGYDRWHSVALQKELKDTFGKDGDKDIFEPISQGFETISDPMGLLEIDLKNKQVLLNNNPVDKWCLLNTAIEFNKIGLQRPVKIKQVGRIDGTLTLIMLYFLYTKYRKEIYMINEIEV